FSSRRRHTRFSRDWSSDVCSSDLAAALAGLGATRARAIWLSCFTGLIEIAAGLAGLGVANAAASVLPALLAAAAGAMLFVVSHEIGRASCRERGGSAVGDGAIHKT